MPGNYSVPNRASGSILTATIYGSDHGLHVTYNTPGGCDDASATVSAMQSVTDPGEVGTESLATDLLGELQRIRKIIAEISGKTYWYQSPSISLESLYGKGADIALASTLVPVGEFEFADVTGSGINVTGINTEAAGKRRKLRFQNAANLIHNGTSLILPFGKIYRTMANEFVTFESLGSGNWIMSDYSGPHEPPGMSRGFLGSAAPSGYVLEDNAALNCTTYEGLFTELVANLDREGYPSAVGTVTADSGTDIITLAAHGLTEGHIVHFANSGGALPAGLTAKTIYYLRDVTTNTFKVAATRGGAAVDLTTNGTGTNSVYNTFLAPDSRGRTDIGIDGTANRITAASTNGGNADTLRGSGGAETHTLVSAEAPVLNVRVGTVFTGSVHAIGGGATAATNMSAFNNSTSVNVGGGGAHSNTQPWRAVTKVVRV